MLTTKAKSIDFVIIVATSSSIMLPVTRIGLVVLPTSTVIAFRLTNSNEFIYDLFINKTQ